MNTQVRTLYIFSKSQTHTKKKMETRIRGNQQVYRLRQAWKRHDLQTFSPFSNLIKTSNKHINNCNAKQRKKTNKQKQKIFKKSESFFVLNSLFVLQSHSTFLSDKFLLTNSRRSVTKAYG